MIEAVYLSLQLSGLSAVFGAWHASSRGVHGMGIGKTGIPWVPWDSHVNGNKISHGMGMGWEWKLSAWEWELRRGAGIVFCE